MKGKKEKQTARNAVAIAEIGMPPLVSLPRSVQTNDFRPIFEMSHAEA